MVRAARETGVVVLSVDYRKAPEHPFPAGFEDALAVTKYALSEEGRQRFGIDPKRVAITGDSAGGNIATSVAIALKSKLKLQIPAYPITQGTNFDTPSYRAYAQSGLVVTQPQMVWYWTQYLEASWQEGSHMEINKHVSAAQQIHHNSNMAKHITKFPVSQGSAWKQAHDLVLEDMGDHFRSTNASCEGSEDVVNFWNAHKSQMEDSRLSPLSRSLEELKGSPRAVFFIAGRDVLRDDGLMYASRLIEAGNDVDLKFYKNGFHGVLNGDDMEMGKEAQSDFLTALKDNV